MQHVATHRNRVAKRTQHVVPNNVARCCVEMLRAFGQAFSHETSTYVGKKILRDAWMSRAFTHINFKNHLKLVCKLFVRVFMWFLLL